MFDTCSEYLPSFWYAAKFKTLIKVCEICEKLCDLFIIQLWLLLTSYYQYINLKIWT